MLYLNHHNNCGGLDIVCFFLVVPTFAGVLQEKNVQYTSFKNTTTNSLSIESFVNLVFNIDQYNFSKFFFYECPGAGKPLSDKQLFSGTY